MKKIMIQEIDKILVGIFFLSIIFGLSVVQVQGQTTIQPVKNPGLYIREDPDLSYSNLDPSTNYETGGSGLNSLLCETLYDYNGNSLTDLVPALAADMWTLSEDGLQYNVSLKRGVKFHDGIEFNAWVYKYSIDRVLLVNDHNSAGYLISMISGAEGLQEEQDLNATSQKIKDYFNKSGVKVLDDYTIQFNLAYPYSAFWQAMTYQVACAVSPRFVISTIPSDYKTDENDDTFGMIDLKDWFPDLHGNYTKLGLSPTHDSKNSGVVPSSPEGDENQHDGYIDQQIGTGPWKLTTKTQEIIKMDRNVDWWALDPSYNSGYVEPEEVVDQIIIESVSDPATRALSLKEGYADSVQIDPEFVDEFINPNGTSKLAQIKAYKFDTLNIGFWGFNQADGDDLDPYSIVKSDNSHWRWDNQTAMNNSGLIGYNYLKNSDGSNRHPNITNPFTALNFRRAFSYAFDYQAYIDTALNGFATRLEGLIPRGLLGHQDDLIEQDLIPEYNPEKAKALFEEVGWKGAIAISFNSAGAARRTAVSLLQSSIDSLNVGIEIFVHECCLGFIHRDYIAPMFLLGWAPDFADPDNYMTPFIHSTKGYYSNRISYFNPEWDKKLTAATNESDPVKRDLLYRELEIEVANESIFMYTNQRQAVSSMHYWWHGWETSGSENPMRNFPRIHYMEKKPTSLPNYTTPSSNINNENKEDDPTLSGLGQKNNDYIENTEIQIFESIFSFISQKWGILSLTCLVFISTVRYNRKLKREMEQISLNQTSSEKIQNYSLKKRSQYVRVFDSELLDEIRETKCVVCFTHLYDSGEFIICPFCRKGGHLHHMISWIYTGNNYCPTCKQEMLNSSYYLIEAY